MVLTFYTNPQIYPLKPKHNNMMSLILFDLTTLEKPAEDQDGVFLILVDLVRSHHLLERHSLGGSRSDGWF